MSELALHRPKAASGQPLQMALAFIHDDDVTHQIALWDLAPRFVFYTDKDKRESGRFLDTIHRQFDVAGMNYDITLKPARVERDTGEPGQRVEVDVYPAEREQLVEEVIRRIAIERGRARVVSGKVVQMDFSIYEIRQELERTKHTYSFAEVKEALHILSEAKVEIRQVSEVEGKKTKDVLRSSAFPQMALRERDEEGQAMLEFNWLVAQSIRDLDYSSVNYELVMELSKPLSRWLYKRLHLAATADAEAGKDYSIQIMQANDIVRNSGITKWKRERDTFARVREAITILQKAKILQDFHVEDRKEGRKTVDQTYDMILSEEFKEEVKRAAEDMRRTRSDFSQLSGGANPREGFVPMTDEMDTTLRKKRTQRQIASAEVQA